MDPRILLTHSKSSKAGKVEEFPIHAKSELTVGRDPSVDVRYDNDRDDLVSRRHLKITIKSTNPPEFSITDLGSRNGTFVNSQRVFGTMPIQPGDTVQVGAGGPEFKFDINPRSADEPARTRTAEIEPAGREPEHATVPDIPKLAEPTPARQPKPRRDRAMPVLAITAVIVVAALSAGGFMLWRNGIVERSLAWWRMKWPATAIETAHANRAAVASIETRWRLVDVDSGRQLYQVYAPNQMNIPGTGSQLPVFLLLDSNQIEPVLTLNPGLGRAIGGRSSGSGFAVDPTGSVITVQQLAEPWRAPFHWAADDAVGVLYFQQGNKLAQAVISAAQFPKWIPSEAKFVLQGSLDKPGNAEMRVEGKADSLDVTFPALRIQSPARVIRVFDSDGVAVIKLASATPLPVLKPYDSNDSLHAGDPATVIRSSAGDSRTTVTSEKSEHAYVLSVGPLDDDASGSPVLDDEGRLIAIYNINSDEGFPVPTAIPLHLF